MRAISSAGVAVTAASARFLLAMKLRAARVEQDVDDIRFLVRLIGLQSVNEVLAVAEERYPVSDLQTRARFLVEEIFSPER
jgi:hypothetical protein